MKTRVKMLKVKIKSLATEAHIIRLEERRAGKDDALRCELHDHRVKDVRREQRHALLAYAFLRGVPYAKVEPKVGRKGEPEFVYKPDWSRVRQLMEKFGVINPTDKAVQSQAFREWVDAAVKV